MSRTKNQTGMAILELILILVAVALISFVGYRVYDARKVADAQLDQSTTEQSSDSDVPQVNSTADLNSAEQFLDQVNPDDSNSDSTELDSQMEAF